jgi:hypothetical protein
MFPMTKKKLLIVPMLLLLLCVSAFIIVAFSTNPAVGVRGGNSFTYYMGADYTSTQSNATVQVPEFEANNTDWVRINIISTSGSIINSSYTLHYKNGTDQYITGQTDVSHNIWNFSHFEFRGVPICPANLNAQDKASSLDLTINETLTRMVLGQRRQLNHITWNSTLERGDLYFDRMTGMLVEMYRAHAFVNRETGEAVTKGDIIKLTSTNVW